jgi:hypothetical protein
MDVALQLLHRLTSSIGGALPPLVASNHRRSVPNLSDMKYGFTTIKNVIIAAFDHRASVWE